MSKTLFHRSTIAIVAAAALAGLVMATTASAEVPSSEVPDDLEQAIQDHIEGLGHDYAGFCRDIEQSEHHGEYCIFVLELDDDTAKVTFGAVASDEMKEVTFTKDGSTWSTGAASPTPVPPTPSPPDTGSGNQSQDGSNNLAYTLVVIILAGGALAGVTAHGATRRR